MSFSRLRTHLAACMLLLLSTPLLADFHAPDLKANIFNGDLSLAASVRHDAATNLIILARNKLDFTNPQSNVVAARIIGVALHLDPDSAEALTLLDSLSRDETPKKSNTPRASANNAADALRKLADSEKSVATPPDHFLAAYLYALLHQLYQKNVDLLAIQDLKKDGTTISWSWADGAGGSGASASERLRVRPLTEIHGLVVSQAFDGLYHGKAIDIIATNAHTPGSKTHISILGDTGPEMLISFQEAIRILDLKHPGASKINLEISFGDKYSPKDGGSAGTAFTLLLLSSLHDFDLNPDAAITGDITVDSKVRAVGEVPAKVHGGALDHMKLVAIPLSNAPDMDDAIVLQGPSSMWETQIFSVQTLPDAIAIMRKDPSPSLTQAMALFDQLRTDYEKKPVTALASAPASDTLQQILTLAPNHVSAQNLQRLAQGKGPLHLSMLTTITDTFGILTPLVPAMMPAGKHPEYVDVGTVALARKNVAHLQKFAEPAAFPFLNAADAFCAAYARCSSAANDNAHPSSELPGLQADLRQKAAALRSAVQAAISDPAVIDKIFHQ